MKPLILVSNDDGIESPHLKSLVAGLEAETHAEVLVVAPERERSAASHAITLHKPLRIKERATNRFSVSGTPVDCVYVGVMRVAPRPPSLVISGINRGFNLGTDVFYSGTVAAATEGGLRGSVGIAVSLDPRPSSNHGLSSAVAATVGLANAALENPPESGTVLNVNVPHEPKGMRWTCAGRRFYKDDVREREDPRGHAYYWIGGGAASDPQIDNSDCSAVAAGFIAVTPLHINRTHETLLAEGTPAWDVPGFDWK